MVITVLYICAMAMVVISYTKDKDKTKEALKKSWRFFGNIMPQFLGIIFVVGIMLAVLKPEEISSIVGSESGVLGVIISSVVGSITMMPTFVAFHTGDMLLKSGAGFAQMGALVSTLTMVGLVTYPLESKYIGRKAAFYRNLLAFLFSFAVAFVMGRVMG